MPPALQPSSLKLFFMVSRSQEAKAMKSASAIVHRRKIIIVFRHQPSFKAHVIYDLYRLFVLSVSCSQKHAASRPGTNSSFLLFLQVKVAYHVFPERCHLAAGISASEPERVKYVHAYLYPAFVFKSPGKI